MIVAAAVAAVQLALAVEVALQAHLRVVLAGHGKIAATAVAQAAKAVVRVALAAKAVRKKAMLHMKHHVLLQTYREKPKIYPRMKRPIYLTDRRLLTKT